MSDFAVDMLADHVGWEKLLESPLREAIARAMAMEMDAGNDGGCAAYNVAGVMRDLAERLQSDPDPRRWLLG